MQKRLQMKSFRCSLWGTSYACAGRGGIVYRNDAPTSIYRRLPHVRSRAPGEPQYRTEEDTQHRAMRKVLWEVKLR